MHDSVALTWTEVVEKYRSAMVDELAARLDSEIRDAVTLALAKERAQASTELDRVRTETFETTREATLRDTAEALNQTLRRLRQAAAQGPALALLAEGSSPWAKRVVVLSFQKNQSEANQPESMQAVSLAARGFESDENAFIFRVAEAAAIGAAIESKDPVIALASGSEISPVLAAAFGNDSGLKAYLFPILARQNIVAMLVASGVVAPAPLELLCEAAGMKMESLTPESAPALKPLKDSELVQIAPPSVPAAETVERRAWNDLTPEDQKLHLQAQRVARVRVAEMRLYQAEDLRKGVFSGDIYATLAPEIDKARTEFLQTFLSKSTTMVDYLHLEILRSLAHDDDRLLGHDYPGPMV